MEFSEIIKKLESGHPYYAKHMREFEECYTALQRKLNYFPISDTRKRIFEKLLEAKMWSLLMAESLHFEGLFEQQELTDEEANKAYEDAEEAPLSEEAIVRIVEKVTKS